LLDEQPPVFFGMKQPSKSLTPCPYLPDIGAVRYQASELAKFRHGPRGAEFYYQALCCAQSRWLEGLPAQALLMLNRAMSAQWLGEDQAVLAEWPVPYRAVRWLLRHGSVVGFMGNPRRHFQHLATRMSGHDRERRVARAWACWELARIENSEWEADEVQLSKEGIVEPTSSEISEALQGLGLPGEWSAWQAALRD
jgi:hypothetical protein